MKNAASPPEKSVFEEVYAWVLRIPPGRVMSYGQISRLMDERLSAVAVGWAMRVCPQDERRIPWHRVVNAQGGVSTGKISVQTADLQRRLLEAEGVAFGPDDRFDLKRFQWTPGDR
jgi:methylated-DNA-protein-cysteine methyltransferase related protein